METFIVILVMACLGVFIKDSAAVQGEPDRKSQQAVSGTDARDGTWPVCTPRESGFDAPALESAVKAIGAMDGVYSLLVVHNRCLVVERYFRDGSRTKPHNLKSATKSILSALVGIAVDKGLIRLDQPIADFLPQVCGLDDDRKRNITVRHLLTMTSGLAPTSYQAYNSWIRQGDWVITILNQPMVADPGTLHQYSTGDAHILAAVLTAATGTGVRDFACRNLFDPLDIEVKGWDIDPQGIQQGGNNLSLVPRDMARIGQLYLDRGRFGTRTLVPGWWVDASTRPGYMGAHAVYGYYGYLWYSRPGGSNDFVAVGFGGQYIYVSPEHETVLIVTSTLTSKGDVWEKQLFNILQNKILALVHRSGTDASSSSPDNGLGPGGQTSPDSVNSMKSGLTRRAVVLDYLNLRKGPGEQYPKQQLLTPGTVLDIVEETGQWLKAVVDDQDGWVAVRFVRIIKPEELKIISTPSASPVPASVDTAVPDRIPAPVSGSSQAVETKERIAPFVFIQADPDDLKDEVSGLKQELASQKQRADSAEIKATALSVEIASLRRDLDILSRNFLQQVKDAGADRVHVREQLDMKADTIKTRQLDTRIGNLEFGRAQVRSRLSGLAEEIQKGGEFRQSLAKDLAGVRSRLSGLAEEIQKGGEFRQSLAKDLTGVQLRLSGLAEEIQKGGEF
ncbi:MAG: serine hydrolase, partial [Pseudomonadota bacterium]